MISLCLGFIVCTAAIVYSGTRLSKYGDIIAEKMGLGRAWVGLVLLASVTSLPELITGISSVTFVVAPDIAVGDVLGSCVVNMLIISLLDINKRIMPISTRARQGNILSAAFGIVLLGIVTISLHMGRAVMPLGWIGPYSIIFITIYLIAMRLVYFFEKRQISEAMKAKAIELRYKDISMKTAPINYGVNAFVVIIVASFLPGIGMGMMMSRPSVEQEATLPIS